MRRFARSTITAMGTVALLLAPLTPLAAQGALSLQGYGYPTGQLSTRAAGTAGALGETDAGSPLNPASLPGGGRTFFSFQIDPEYRSVKVNGSSVKTNVARFPVIAVGAKVAPRAFVGVSFSTLFDRTSDATYQDTVRVSGELAASTVSTAVRGAINDARLAFAWQYSDRLQIGLGYHLLSGNNGVRLARVFSDSATFGTLLQTTNFSFAGSAFSGGLLAVPVQHVIVAASVRVGGTMTLRSADTVVSRGNAPSRYGVSVVYVGIPGSQLAVRYSREQWSRMRSLGSASLLVNDATDVSAGLDVAGPKMQGIASQFRLGARVRDLPFGWSGHVVNEKTIALGAQLPLARGWASADLALQRAMRSAGGVSENGMIVSFGLTVRP